MTSMPEEEEGLLDAADVEMEDDPDWVPEEVFVDDTESDA